MPEVTEIIQDARQYASDSFNSADSLVQQAVSNALGSVILTPPPFPNRSSIPDIELPEVQLPDLPGEFRPDAERPERPTLQQPTLTTPDFDAIEIPEPINIQFPEAPAVDIPQFNRDVPEVADTEIPELPDVRFPDRPDLLAIDIPDAPSVTVPGFDPIRPGQAPTDVPDADEILRTSFNTVLPEMRAFLEGQVDALILQHSPEHYAIMGRLEERLREMVEGGTALPENIEQALFDRTRRRTQAENLANERQSIEEVARRGFTMPTGAVQAAIVRAARDGHNANVQAAAEVNIRQAELEQQNIQFALQLTSTMRQSLLDAGLQWAQILAGINRDALQYAQAVSNAAVQVYSLRLELFRAQVQYFQAQAQVYEVELRAAFAELERFQALIRVEELKGNINSQLIQQYRQEAEVQRTIVQTYSEQLRGLEILLRRDQLRIQAFGAEVQAYNTRLQSKELEFNIYRAALDGEQTKAAVFSREVDVYRTRVQAESEKLRGQAVNVESQLNVNRSQTEIFRNEMQAYGIDIQSAALVTQTDLQRYSAALQQYGQEASIRIQKAQTDVENARLDFQAAAETFRGGTQVSIEQGRLFADRIRVSSDAAISGAGVFANIAAAAVSSQNTMVSRTEEILSQLEP